MCPSLSLHTSLYSYTPTCFCDTLCPGLQSHNAMHANLCPCMLWTCRLSCHSHLSDKSPCSTMDPSLGSYNTNFCSNFCLYSSLYLKSSSTVPSTLMTCCYISVSAPFTPYICSAMYPVSVFIIPRAPTSVFSNPAQVVYPAAWSESLGLGCTNGTFPAAQSPLL